MTEPYIPTTEDVRLVYAFGVASDLSASDDDYAEFDRWLAGYRAQVSAAVEEMNQNQARTIEALLSIILAAKLADDPADVKAILDHADRIEGGTPT